MGRMLQLIMKGIAKGASDLGAGMRSLRVPLRSTQCLLFLSVTLEHRTNQTPDKHREPITGVKSKIYTKGKEGIPTTQDVQANDGQQSKARTRGNVEYYGGCP